MPSQSEVVISGGSPDLPGYVWVDYYASFYGAFAVSEYQYYEFITLDRPLAASQMAELRAISTRADISSTRFCNEYHWGNLKTDPTKLVARYFDAHLYYANWGTHRLMLRVPKSRVDVKRLKPYFTGGNASCLKVVGNYVLFDFVSDTEVPEDDDQSQGLLATLSPLRAEVIRGDFRPAYLAWLLSVQTDDFNEGALEPPVPAGLAMLTSAQQAMVDFLRIDVDLLFAARTNSNAAANSEQFRRWVTLLTTKEKDAWLRKAVEEPDLTLGNEMLRAFGASYNTKSIGTRRTVADLRALAETQSALRERAEAEREKKAARAYERERQRRLTRLGRNIDSAWLKLGRLVESSSYDEAVKLAIDLRDLATRNDGAADFAGRLDALRRRHARRRGFFSRWRSTHGNRNG